MKTQKKLHIVFLDLDDIRNPLLAAGQARATFEVGTRLAKLGHKITVISSKYPGSKNRTEQGIEYKHIGFTTNNIKINNIIYIFSLPFAIKKLNADIIVECFTSPMSTLCSQLFTKIPVVGLPSSFDAKRHQDLYHLPFEIIEKLGAKTYKYFLPYSKFFEDKMKNYNPKIISRIVPEGVSDEYIQMQPKTPKHILYLGRLDIHQKGIDLLLQSYAKIADKATYPLVIAGNGPDEERVKQLIKQYKLEKSVTMIGPTFGEKKEKYMTEALYIAFTSRSETFSCFALEALAAGLPLIAFDIPGIAWSGNTVALKAPAFNTDTYAELLLSSMDEKKMRTLGKKAKEFAKGFTWDHVVKEYENFFREIVGGVYER